MHTYPTLSNAPITEAIIELRFPGNISFSKIIDFCDSIRNDFPHQQIQNLTQITFAIKESGKNPVGEQKELGSELIVVTSEDKRKIFQFGKNKAVFGRVGKYSNWDEFSSDALKTWDSFQRSLNIKTLTRVGVRFINNLNLPNEIGNYSEYLKIAPIVPPEISNPCVGFLTRVFLNNEKIDASGIVAQALDPNQAQISGKRLPVTLDIDVFIIRELPSSGTKLADRLSDLRDYKNNIFFNSLTQKALEFYK